MIDSWTLLVIEWAVYRQEHKTEALPPGRYKQPNELLVIKLLHEQ